MSKNRITRRAAIAGAAALAATGSRGASAQPAQDISGQFSSAPQPREFIIRGAHVLSMDTAVGDLASGDVHVRDGAIVAVARSIAAPGVQSVDGRGMIAMPGFVETHWHLWTSILRPLVRGDAPDQGYFPVTAKLGPHYTPDDSYRAVRLGVAEALSAGVTSLHNWAHNVRSPAHADAEIAAMHDMGIRGRFSYGTPQGHPNDQPMDLADLARLKRDVGDNPMLSLGIASRNVGNDPNPLRGNVTTDMAKREWTAARELGLTITLHTSGPSPVHLLEGAGLLGPDVQLVHPLLTSAEERAILKERGTSYSTAPIGESGRPASAGVIQLGELLESGVKVSMSIDHTTNYNCDCFACMRTLMNLHKHRIGNRIPLTNRRLVELATIDGARDLRFDDKVGSLTPGKRADLILIRTTDINMAPVGDPYEALVSLALPSNIDTVVVDGRIVRRGGRFVTLDEGAVVRQAAESLADLKARAGWT